LNAYRSLAERAAFVRAGILQGKDVVADSN